jgi:hypothetical protein
MSRWGCAGIMIGSGAGFLLLALLILLSHPTPSSTPPQTATIAPDVTLFTSARVLSRLAEDALQRPAFIEFTTSGDMRVTTTAPVGPFQPVVTAQIQLDMQGANVVSNLSWVKVGFLTIPGRWLPASVQEVVAQLGQSIQNRVPPDFVLIGLTPTSEGLEFKLKWVGQ